MAIIKKSDLQRHLVELETRYQKFKTAAAGVEPNPNVFDQYSNNPAQYKNEFTEVNLDDLYYALVELNGVLGVLKSLKKLQAPRIKAK